MELGAMTSPFSPNIFFRSMILMKMIILNLFISLLATSSTNAVLAVASPSPDLVRSSCTHASYPDVCVRTLSTYAGAANTPRELAQAAVKISISRARKACDYLTELKNKISHRERDQKLGAVKDCVSQISDSVEELRKTLEELKQLKRGTFRWQMSNAETWVSAALTNEETCLDGFKEMAVIITTPSDVKKKIANVAKVTSNALYLINRLDQGGSHHSHP